MNKRTVRRVVIYARISIALEKSVSIERQIEAANQYAAARGWKVVGTFTDAGISATHNRPEDRAGWRALLDSPEPFDVVLIWKIDRLARRVADFLEADRVLQERDAAVAAVEDPIDMSTPTGRAFAVMLSVFAELEAQTTAARVAAARTYMIQGGRAVGGKPPFGWRNVPNPDGPGKVIAHDPDTTGVVREMVERIQRGGTVYSVVQWLNEAGVRTPTGNGSTWAYTTVERILRHPVLAGMTPFNPGTGGQTRTRGAEVLRDESGLPVVDESVAVMPLNEWRAMVKQLDDRDTPQSKPRALKAKTSGLLSGLVWCGDPRHDEPVRMWRGTIQKRHGYYCPDCHQVISGPKFEPAVIADFLAAKGDWPRWRKLVEVQDPGTVELPEIEHRLDELDDLIRTAPDRDARRSLQEQQADLLDKRDELRATAPQVTLVPVGGEPLLHFDADWDRAETVEDKRAILGDALERVLVRRGGGGGPATDEKIRARLTYEWVRPDEVGPFPEP